MGKDGTATSQEVAVPFSCEVVRLQIPKSITFGSGPL